MSNYTKSTNFAAKDALASGNPLKIVKGTEIDTEFNNIATAVATKTDNASAAITGGTITGATVDNTVIGGTTPANGTFSTMSGATGSNFRNDLTSDKIVFNPGNTTGRNRTLHYNYVTSSYVGNSTYASQHYFYESTNLIAGFTSNGFFTQTSTTPLTLGENGQMTISRVNNTTLKLSLRGTDGVTRSVELTLS